MVRVSRTEVGDNLTPLLGELAALVGDHRKPGKVISELRG
jgi:hypothetical protein